MLRLYVGVDNKKVGYVLTEDGKEVVREVSGQQVSHTEEESLLDALLRALKKVNYLHDMKKLNKKVRNKGGSLFIIVDNEKVLEYIKGSRKIKKFKLSDILFNLALELAVSRYELEFLSNENIVKIKVFGEENINNNNNFEKITDIL